MKKLLVLFIFCISMFNFAFAKTKIEVLKVYDGDSILAKIDNNIFRIRLIGIDCFEGTKNKRIEKQSSKHNFSFEQIVKEGNIAGDILRVKLKGKKVFFEFAGIDKYNRALGHLYVGNRNINDEMLKTGYCFKY